MTPAVLGVDGCTAGWVGALLRSGRVRLLTAPTMAALVERARTYDEPSVVGIDIPIGLPDDGSRQADVVARTALPRGRKSSVFPTPARAAVAATTWQEANAANREATGKGLSHQGFHLCHKIAEVDAWVRGDPEVSVIEVHPEVSFTALGAATVTSKRTAQGRETRAAALRAAGITLPGELRGPGYAVDDALDACAVAWTARRHAAGESRAMPEHPERFSDGLVAAIHV